MSKKKTDLDEEEYMQKRVAHYQILLTAWFENRMELDKRLITLSTAAIGFLMFFYNELEETLDEKLWLYAGLSFILTIVTILLAIYINPSYIKCVIDENHQGTIKETILNNVLKILTFIPLVTFVSGVVSVFMVMVFKSNLIW